MRLTLLSEDKEFFTYDDVEKESWSEAFTEAKEEYNASFDLENDDSVTQRKLKIEQNYWTLDHTKDHKGGPCRFNCELRKGGGDWEFPSIYFRCQITDGYCWDSRGQHNNGRFCVIPPKDGGNPHFVKGDNKYGSPSNSEVNDPEEPDEKKAWAWLKTHLKELVDKEGKSVG